MKVLVTGSGGQLSSEFENIYSKNNDWSFVSVNDLDITRRKKVLDYFKNKTIDLVINCAAYTAVDLAEDEINKCYRVNEIGVINLDVACKLFNAKLIHFSTDYVFDGNNKKPYTELNDTNPITVYGKSKLAGETILTKSTTKSIIIRTSWVYSRFGNNFVKTMIKLSKDKEILNVVEDQYGSPTNAEDLALATIKIIENKSYIWKHGEVFHYSNEGQCSWYEFAKQIFELLNFNNIKVVPISSKEFKTKAVRPKYSLLDKSKIKTKFNIKIDKWEKSLEKMLNNPNYL